MPLHSTNQAEMHLAHLKTKEAALLEKLSRLKNQTSSVDHDIEGATTRAQYQLADLQREISMFGQPPAPPPAPPAPPKLPSLPVKSAKP